MRNTLADDWADSLACIALFIQYVVEGWRAFNERKK